MTKKLKIAVDNSKSHVDLEQLLDFAQDQGWSEDPGTGKAVLLPDERGARAYEVFNPMPFAPPIGFEPTPAIEELINQRVKRELDRLRDEEEIDDIVDAEDFDVADELPPLETMYEVIAMEREAPEPRVKEPSLEEQAKAEAEYRDLVDRERLLRKRHREAALKKAQEENLYSDEAGTS